MVKSITSAVLGVLALGLAPQALKATPLCPLGNATLHGTYVVSGGGTIVGLGPVTSVGEVTYDGKGSSNASYTLSANGKILSVTVAGTYTVNPDCTATAVESPSHFNFVITPDGNTVWWISTDGSTVLSGTLVRLHPLESLDASRSSSTEHHAVPANLRRVPKDSASPKSRTKLVTQRTVVAGKAS